MHHRGPAIAPIPFDGSWLPAGWYTNELFTPRPTFRLEEGWHGMQVAPGFFDVQYEPGTPHVVAVQFARPIRVYRVPGESIAVTSAAEAMSLLGVNTSLQRFASGPDELAGLGGWQTIVEPVQALETPVLAVEAGTIGLLPGRRLQLHLLDAEAGLVGVLIVGSSTDWATAVSAAAPILASLRLG
jgi:hypothetical protein